MSIFANRLQLQLHFSFFCSFTRTISHYLFSLYKYQFLYFKYVNYFNRIYSFSETSAPLTVITKFITGRQNQGFSVQIKLLEQHTVNESTSLKIFQEKEKPTVAFSCELNNIQSM